MQAAALFSAIAAVQAPAPAFDAWALRTARPAAFAAELARLRAEWTDSTAFAGHERFALMVLADKAGSAAEYRRRVAVLMAYRARVRAEAADILAGRFRTEWLNGHWANNAVRAREPDVRELFRRVFADQHQLMSEPPAALGEAGIAVVAGDVRTLARANAAWLKTVLARIGWFDIPRSGRNASQAAWLIVQHSDHDRAWQAEILETLRPRQPRGDVQARHVAYLVDRVAVNGGRPQTYGTQGRCMPSGEWQPRAVIDPENLDRRRAEVELEPIAAYRARFTCPAA